MFEDDPSPASIDPDSIPGRLTSIEERLKAMAVELDSLRMSIGHGNARTARHRHSSSTRRRNSIVKVGLAIAMIFVLALFLLYAELAPSPDAGWVPSPTAVPPVAPSPSPSNTAEPDSHF